MPLMSFLLWIFAPEPHVQLWAIITQTFSPQYSQT